MDGMEVRLEPHREMDDKSPIPGMLEHAQSRVYVYCEGFKTTRHKFRNDEGRLQVGWIGTQKGANFCPINAFYEFTNLQKEWMANEAKRQHGHASDKPHVEVPPVMDEFE